MSNNQSGDVNDHEFMPPPSALPTRRESNIVVAKSHSVPSNNSDNNNNENNTCAYNNHTKSAVAPPLSAKAAACSSTKHHSSIGSIKNMDSSSDVLTSKDYYFDSYSHHGIHEEMLKDEVRTKTYQMAIMENKHLFTDKIVLDVGCGTGILSLFAAKAGARHVYAVDSSSIVLKAKEVVELNGYSDRITCIQGKIEELELPVVEIDIILSEWMGYFLLYESMLDTVLYARDRWLRKDGQGLILPDKAQLHICAIEDSSDNIKRDRMDFWNDVYGFDMSILRQMSLQEPVVDVISPQAVITDHVPVLNIDLLTFQKGSTTFERDFTLRVHRNDYFIGFSSFFECAFTQIHKPLGFSTSPFSKYTHWKQTSFYLPEHHTVCEGEEIQGKIYCCPSANNPRDLNITIDVYLAGKYSSFQDTFEYKLR